MTILSQLIIIRDVSEKEPIALNWIIPMQSHLVREVFQHFLYENKNKKRIYIYENNNYLIIRNYQGRWNNCKKDDRL